jgi:hypothetical protein
MQFKWHVLVGFVISYILIYFFNLEISAGLIIFLSSWMIDIDHYFWYGVTARDWIPIHAISWYKKSCKKWSQMTREKRKQFKIGVFIFHSLVFIVILAILSFLSKIFLFILLGVIIHMLLDLIDLIHRGDSLSNKLFLCYIIRKNKNKKSLIKA